MYSITLHLPAGPLYVGLVDLRAQLIDTSGATVGAAISTGFVEVGSAGNYIWHNASMPPGFEGIITFYSNAAPSNILGIATINPAEVEYPRHLPAIRAGVVGRSVADDPDDPTEIIYYAEDDTTALFTHTLTDTERTVA